MCGIAGIVDYGGRPVEPALLRAMAGTIAHRGPDDEGYLLVAPQHGKTLAFSGPASDPAVTATLPDIATAAPHKGFCVGLAHRRFSIIDLTIAGHQPFVSPHGVWAIVYNGEIYNYRELREELSALGYSFASHCDTEVALYAYRQWGVACFDRFNGFWALAIYDPQRRSVLVSRDRLGVKPLYYAVQDNRVYFGSEIKTVLAAPAVRKAAAPHSKSVTDWLAAGLKDHTQNTFFTGVRSFPAGSYAFLEPGFEERTRRFWSLPLTRKRVFELPVEKAVIRFRELLGDAINLRLRADVPLALSLSGGIDSSALLAIARHELGVTLPAFTVRFPDKEADESPFASAASKACGSEQQWIDAPAGSLWEDILPFTVLQDEPYHSPNMHADQQVWSAMRGKGVKVALNGAAGDENFGGYGYHYSLMQLGRLVRGNMGGYVREALRCRDTGSRFEAFIKPLGYAIRERLKSGGARSLDLDARLWQDMRFTIMPYWLAAGDRSYMGIPIEIREPFLDYRIVEFAFSLPLEYLVRGGWQKWIVRKAIEPYLPHEVVWRTRKMGFPFPMQRFFRQSSAIVELIVRSSTSPYTNTYMRKRWKNDWKMLSYLLWHERFVAGNDDLFSQIRQTALRLGPCQGSWVLRPAYLDSCPA
ncbi:MAG: asparagine synthase (glutamine-hydrolyzing) [Chitinispirillaceae bacterium]|nr:asparagine synthase (glutamine-hydrolyzing) [Chitinispirillaceae bacterium]